MINKIKELLKKFLSKKNYKKLRKFKKNSNKISVGNKISIVLLLLLLLDTSFILLKKIELEKNPVYLKTLNLIESTKNQDNNKTIDYQDILNSNKVYFLKGKKENDLTVFSIEDNKTTKFSNIPTYSVVRNFEDKLLEKDIPYEWLNKIEPVKPPIISFLSSNMINILFIGILIFFLLQTMDISIFGKKYEIVYPKDIKGSLKDIIGYDDVKEEIKQVKELIKKRKKYKLYGIESVFNILLTGKPGTGKSKIVGYMAKSLNIPIIFSTGNVDTKFVGSGPAHIRALFKEATDIAEADPDKSCIIFIDEAESLLAQRGRSNNKWEDDSTKELLAYLDGVKKNTSVNIIVIMASNFNENDFKMDDAMARRFKKKIHFREPNLEERVGIIKYYLKKVKSKDKNIDIDFIAKNTSGLTPAIIETIIQEAGLISLRKKENISTENIMKAFENILIGQSDRKTTKDKELIRKIISIHEMGHFIIDYDRYLIKNNNDLSKTKEDIKLLKVSSEAISRSNALGYVLSEQENILLRSVKELEEEIKSLYGGVAAEELFYGKTGITTGSADDINKVTKILQHLVYETGSYVDYKLNLSNLEMDDEYSDELLKEKSIELYNSSKEIIKKHKDLILFLSESLIKNWILTKDDLFNEIEKFNKKNNN